MNLIDKIKSFSYKEIQEEMYGTADEYIEEEEVVKIPNKRTPVEVNGVKYKSMRQATQSTGLNIFWFIQNKVKGINGPDIKIIDDDDF